MIPLLLEVLQDSWFYCEETQPFLQNSSIVAAGYWNSFIALTDQETRFKKAYGKDATIMGTLDIHSWKNRFPSWLFAVLVLNCWSIHDEW